MRPTPALLKYILSLQKNEEKGFVIPLILGIGLFMLIIGLSMIQRGSNSETDSKIQEKTSQALAAGEAGLNRIQFFLSTNPSLAAYNDCATNRVDGVCQDAGATEASWANVNQIPTVKISNGCNGVATDVSLTSLQNSAQTDNWVAIDPGDTTKGEFRLISYTYQPENPADGANSTPGIGTLIIEGRTDQGGASVRDNDAFNTGVVRIETEIPIQTNTQQRTTTVPGLWVKASNLMDPRNNVVRGGGVLIEDLTCRLNDQVPGEFLRVINGDGSINWNNTEGTFQVATSQEPIPDTPDLPSVADLNILKHTNTEDHVGDVFPRGDTDPVTGVLTIKDTASTDSRGNTVYQYLVPYIDQNTPDIGVRDGYTVIFYVQGDIEFAGNANHETVYPTNQADNLQIYGNTDVGAGAGFNGTQFKYGCPADGSVACPTRNMILSVSPSSTRQVRAFVHIPEGSVCVYGNTGDIPLKGVVWAQDWGGNGTTTGIRGVACSEDITIDTSSVEATNLLSASTITTPQDPTIGSFTKWERKEVP